MHPLEVEIANNIQQQQLIRNEEQIIVVAVSGGPDSVALLHLLLPLREVLGIVLVTAYIDHCLRPGEARNERSLVEKMCRELGIFFESEQIDVRGHAGRENISIEHAARDLRYNALRRIAASHNASLIAVGHTADDQAEEILIRLLRGSGRKGISGMRDRTDDIIRPLLSVERNRVLLYLEEKKIPFCMDSSNEDMRFVRNRVRHSLIPFLEEHFDKGIRKALRKSAESLAQDETLLEALTFQAMKEVLEFPDDDQDEQTRRILLSRRAFAGLPPSLQRRVVEQLLWKLHSRASYAHIIRIVEVAVSGKTGSEIHLSRGLRVGVQRGYLEFLYPRGFSPWRGRLYDR